jgi:hypothetical protein
MQRPAKKHARPIVTPLPEESSSESSDSLHENSRQFVLSGYYVLGLQKRPGENGSRLVWTYRGYTMANDSEFHAWRGNTAGADAHWLFATELNYDDVSDSDAVATTEVPQWPYTGNYPVVKLLKTAEMREL